MEASPGFAKSKVFCEISERGIPATTDRQLTDVHLGQESLTLNLDDCRADVLDFARGELDNVVLE